VFTRTPLLALTFVLALLASGCTHSDGPKAVTTTASAASGGAASHPPAASALGSAYVSVIRKVLPSVVLIRAEHDLGSGVIFDDKGDIVTNYHVVGDAKRFEVSIYGSAETRTATLVGSYPADDLAVIKVDDAAALHPATFGDSSKVSVGEIVLAMGNPLGLASSVTNGIVSAVGRTVTEPASGQSPGATLPDTLQTSAAINPGNSGGALVDLSGEVVGIPTLAAVDQQLGGAAPGIGFAISSNIVTDVASQIIQHGKVVVSHRAALGVTVSSVFDGKGNPAGVGIVSVQANSGAADAGLAKGEVILSVNGAPTPDAQTLSALLANLEPGQTVAVKIGKDNGDVTTVNVRLGSLPG